MYLYIYLNLIRLIYDTIIYYNYIVNSNCVCDGLYIYYYTHTSLSLTLSIQCTKTLR